MGCPALLSIPLPPGFSGHILDSPGTSCTTGAQPYLHADDVLAVHLADAVVGEEPVAGSRAVLGQRHDLPLLHHDADVAGAVLVHGHGALERPAGRSPSVLPPALPPPPVPPLAHLSRTTMTIFSGFAFFSARCALSLLQPAQFLPSICSTWSPKRSPTSAAGELAFTSCTKMPWGHSGVVAQGPVVMPCTMPCHLHPAVLWHAVTHIAVP